MPRKRMIDPSFWRDEKISKCNFIERLLFIGLWTFAEDDGVGRANPLLIKADVFPYETLREADIKKSLDKLSSLGLIQLYEVDSQLYYLVSNFKKHQTINKPSQCYLPLPPGVDYVLENGENSSNEKLPEHYGSTTTPVTSEDKLREVKLREDKLNRNNIYSDIISFLNQTANKNYKPNVPKTQRLIDARLKEGFTVDDFKRVIETKCAEWGQAPRDGERDMRQYLRPETLFGTKFESYLNQSPPRAHSEPAAPIAIDITEGASLEQILGVDFGDE